MYTHTISIYYDEYNILHACNHTVTMKFAHVNYYTYGSTYSRNGFVCPIYAIQNVHVYKVAVKST